MKSKFYIKMAIAMAFVFMLSAQNAGAAWPTLKADKQIEKNAQPKTQAAGPSSPPSAAQKETPAKIDTILTTLNESLTENKKLRDEVESSQDLLNRAVIENNVLRSQLRTLQSTNESIKNELSNKEKQTQSGEEKLKEEIESLKEADQKSQEFKKFAEQTLLTTDKENQNLKLLLDKAILQSERDDYVRLINQSTKKSQEAAMEMMIARRQSERMKYELASAYYNLGNLLSDSGQQKIAIEQYEKALKLNPADAWSHYNLAVLYDYYMNDRDKSLYHYKKYLGLEPIKEELSKVRERVLEIELRAPIVPVSPLKPEFEDYSKKLNKPYTLASNS